MFLISFFVFIFFLFIGFLMYPSEKTKFNSFVHFTGLLLAFVYGAALIGFLIGFVGPVIFTPDAAQGPLLGIFITGPAGAIIGLVAFMVYVFNFREST